MHNTRLGIEGAAEFKVILLYKLIREHPLAWVAALCAVALLLNECVTIGRLVTRYGFARFILQLKLFVQTLSIFLMLILSLGVDGHLFHALIQSVVHVVTALIELANR